MNIDKDSRVFSKRWHVLCAAMVGAFMIAVDASTVNLILPTLVNDLKTSFAMVQWVMAGYFLTVSTLIIIMGRLGDMLGNKVVFLFGLVLYTAGSLLCGFSGSIWWLIGFRVMQGIGGAMIIALSFAVATTAIPKSELGKAMGILTSIIAFGCVLWPIIGGFLVDALSWRWIFFMNLPIGLAGILMVVRYVPNTFSKKKSVFDFAGSILLFLSMLFLLMGLTLGQKTGFTSTKVAGLFICSIACALIFIRMEMKVKFPIINLHIFKNISLSANLIILFFCSFSISGIFVLIPFYFQDILGYPPNKIGFLFGLLAMMTSLFSPVSGILSDRLGNSTIIIFSLIMMLLSYSVVALNINHNPTTTSSVCAMLIIGSGFGLYLSPSQSAIMGADISKAYRGSISSFLALAKILGQSTGVAIMGAIWTIRVRAHGGGILENDITDYPVTSKIQGFQDIAFFTIIITLFSLMFFLWINIRSKGNKKLAKNTI